MPSTRSRLWSLTLLLACRRARRAVPRPRPSPAAGLGSSRRWTATACCTSRATPYEMGYQQGALLRDDIRENVQFLFEVKAQGDEGRARRGQAARPQAGRSPGSRPSRGSTSRSGSSRRCGASPTAPGLDVQDVIVANFIPELFHCSGFALSGSATKDGTLYHGRILDYGCDWRLQEHAVLTVAEPRGQDPVRERDLCRVRRLGDRHERRADLDRRDGGPGAGPLGRRADGLPRPHGARGGRRPRPGDRRLPRSSADLRILLRDRRRQDRQGRWAWKRRGTSSAWSGWARAIPRLPDAVKDAVLLSAGDRYKELVAAREGGASARSTPERRGT